jgi:hypothetical protein
VNTNQSSRFFRAEIFVLLQVRQYRVSTTIQWFVASLTARYNSLLGSEPAFKKEDCFSSQCPKPEEAVLYKELIPSIAMTASTTIFAQEQQDFSRMTASQWIRNGAYRSEYPFPFLPGHSSKRDQTICSAIFAPVVCGGCGTKTDAWPLVQDI